MVCLICIINIWCNILTGGIFLRKVYLKSLPKWEKGTNKDKINWKDSVNHIIGFVYDDIEGEFKILDYDSGKRILKLQYKNASYLISPDNLRAGKLKVIIGKINKFHKYNVGDIVEDVNFGKLEITAQIRVKRGNYEGNARYYKYKCLICNNEDRIKETSLEKKAGCNVCSNRKVKIGYNDIHTTNRGLGDLLWNKEDKYKYTEHSNYKVDWKCPDCGCKIENKMINSINKIGLSCPKCSDGLSIPEKFMFNFLNKVYGGEFEVQKTFKWSKEINHNNIRLSGDKRYDFYLPKFNCIIEVHGGQHYITGFGGGRSLEEEIENDRLKEKLAIENGIDNYIIINCKYSELEWIKNNILNSELIKYLELGNISDEEWMVLYRNSLKTKIKDVCELWNNISDVVKVGEITKLSKNTVITYLKKGDLVGWCNYNPDEQKIKNAITMGKSNCKKVVQLSIDGELIEIWESAREIDRKLGINYKSISQVCTGKRKSAGGFRWILLDNHKLI